MSGAEGASGGTGLSPSRLLSLSAIGYFGVAAITIYDVVARFVFNSPTTWVLELSLLICGLIFLANCLTASLSNAHIRIDAMRSRAERLVPGKVLDMVDFCASAVFLLAIAYGGAMQARNALAVMERSGTVWNSYAPTIVKVAIPATALAMAVPLLRYAVRRLVRR